MDADAGGRERLPAFLRFLVAAASDASVASAMRLSPEDWEDVPIAAYRHGLAALLPAALAGRSDVPPPVRDQVTELQQARVVRALGGMAAVQQTCAAFRDAGIPAVALKGPAFSQWLYGDFTFRRFSDIDLLVRIGDRDHAHDVLRRLDYALPVGMSKRVAAVIYSNLGAWPLIKPDALPVDLHWRLAQRRFPAPLSAADVIAASQPISERQATVHVPSATHAAVLTLLHASKHLWCTLEILLAIARLMRRTDVDWELVEALLRRSHGLRGAVTGLSLASGLFGAPLPAPAFANRETAAVRRLRDAAFDALSMPPGEFSDRWQERRIHRDSMDRWSDRVRYDAWRLVAPTPAEWAWWPLPGRFAALYAPLRMVRLGAAAARYVWTAHPAGSHRKRSGAATGSGRSAA
jgi:hypothetical protein